MEKTKKQLGKLSRGKGNGNENRLASKLDKWFYGSELDNWDYLFPEFSEWSKVKRRILRRTPMSGGWSKCGDLKMDPEFGHRVPKFPIFVEAKKEEKLDPTDILKGIGSLYKYLAQAHKENAKKLPMTAVIFSKNFSPDYMMVYESEFDSYINSHSTIKHCIHDAVENVVLFPLDEFLESADLKYFRGLCANGT